MKLWKITALTKDQQWELDRVIQRAGFHPVLEYIVSTMMSEADSEDNEADERAALQQLAQEIDTAIQDMPIPQQLEE